jgi:acetyl esterase
MALDEATAALLHQFAASGNRPVTELTPAQAREQSAAMRAQRPPGPEMTRVRDARVQAAGGAFPVRVLIPGDQPRAVIVYYHGGGWVLGSIEDSDALGRHLAQRTGCAVILAGYRLAPEYRYPTAVEDSLAALRWAAGHLDEIAGARVPLIVAGDSAGGNLAAVVARRARLAGGPPVALQVLIYPVTDHDLTTTSYADPANRLLLTSESMAWFWDHYAPDPRARMHPDASPLRAPDLTGLPPAVVLTAEHDVLRDEGELYATRLLKAGVPVLHRRFPGQMHGFFTMTGILPGSDEGIGYVADAITSQLDGGLRSPDAPAATSPAMADVTT